MPAAVAYQQAQRLQARQAALDHSAWQDARRAQVCDVAGLRATLDQAGLPFTEELVPPLLHEPIRTRRARRAKRWRPPAPSHRAPPCAGTEPVADASDERIG